MEETKEKQVIYELAYLLRIGENESIIEAVLSEHGATVTQKGPVTQVQLAYPIKKQGNAMFGFYQFTAAKAESIKAMNEALKLKDQVIRCIFVKVPKKKPMPAPRVRPATAAGEPEKKTPIMPAVENIDSLSNEKLEETLEEILK